MNKEHFVDIVILNFECEKDTIECLASIEKMKNKNYRVILVDNGSTDGSGQRIRDRFGYVDFMRSEENIGFAGGCNLGARRSLELARADCVLFLNNDTIVDENLLDELLEAARPDEKAGIVGAVNYYYSDPSLVHMAGHRFIWWLGVQRSVRRIRGKYKEIPAVSGCCMLIKKEVMEKIGFFDERFFAYYEDADYCLRARRNGFKVLAARDAKVWHKIGRVLGAKTYGEYYIYSRNQPLFMLKNCPRIFLPDFFMVYIIKIFSRMAYFFIISKKDNALAIWRGFIDFFKGNFGKGKIFYLQVDHHQL